MATRLKRIGPLHFGLVAGLLYAILGLVIIVPMMLIMTTVGYSSLAAHHPATGGPNSAALAGTASIGMLVFTCVMAPIMYFAMGFVLGALGALVYNLTARWTGGIEFEYE